MRPKLKIVSSWLAEGLGLLVGFVALARFGMSWPPFNDDLPGWVLRWIEYGGGALLGVVFLAGTIVALRNPKRAGIIFLTCMPVAVFCLAYPSSGYLVWHSDGSGWFEPPEIPTAVGLTTLFFLLIFAALLAVRYKKRAVYLFVVIAVLAGIVFGRSHWTKAFIPPFAGWSALFLAFGLFWLGTNKRGWASPLQPRPRPLGRQAAAVVLSCIVVFCVDVAFTFGLSALGSSLFSPDCGGHGPAIRPRSPYHAVFTARIVFVGRSLEALTRGPSSFLSSKGYDARVGDWAIGVVHEKFWGLPLWTPRLVLLTNFVYWKGETYFIDGSRGHGLLTERLPIVEGGLCGGRTRPVSDAIVDLRLLHAQSATGTRLIGYVREPAKFVGGLAPPVPLKLAAGAKIRVTGPAGTRIVTTDPSGVYEVDDLPPSDYTLQLLVPDGQIDGFFSGEESPAKVHLDGRGPVEQNFELFWNGRIEGRVEDDSGKPAHVWVMLMSADGAQLPGFVNFFQMTNKDGSYEIEKIPAGRYVLLVNPNGPYDEWPYDIQYYPSTSDTRDARILEMIDGQEIKGIDFRVQRLRERTIQVRVTWPNGNVAAAAHVGIAYEHTKDYESLEGTNTIKDTDKNGFALVHVYGHSRVRVFAEQFVDNAKKKWWDTYYSHPVEAEVGKLPDEVHLVLTSPKP
jgi:hypothetical protein